jgi:pilus assembly protein Flp/PilA
MRPMIDLFIRICAEDESGATAVEYSLIAVFVSIAAILAMQALGGELAELFEDISSVLEYGLEHAGL